MRLQGCPYSQAPPVLLGTSERLAGSMLCRGSLFGFFVWAVAEHDPMREFS